MAMSQTTSMAIPQGETPAQLRKQVLNLAMPSVGEQVLNLLVGIVSTMLVGHLGASALAAVGLATTITIDRPRLSSLPWRRGAPLSSPRPSAPSSPSMPIASWNSPCWWA